MDCEGKSDVVRCEVHYCQILGQILFDIYLKYISNSADIDECAEGIDNCNVNAECGNTFGSFVCACNMGFTGDGVQCDGMLTLVFLIIKR